MRAAKSSNPPQSGISLIRRLGERYENQIWIALRVPAVRITCTPRKQIIHHDKKVSAVSKRPFVAICQVLNTKKPSELARVGKDNSKKHRFDALPFY